MADTGWIAISAGLVSASLTLSAGIVLEGYKRHRDKQAMAMAFLGEIKTLIELSKRLELTKQAEEIAKSFEMIQSFGENKIDFSGMDRISIGNPVFDKAADKIGLLPEELPVHISEFYNYIVGLRISYFSSISDGPMSIKSRISLLKFVASKWPEMEALAQNKIIPQLTLVASQRWIRLPKKIKQLQSR